jgi:hypothetical protein
LERGQHHFLHSDEIKKVRHFCRTSEANRLDAQLFFQRSDHAGVLGVAEVNGVGVGDGEVAAKLNAIPQESRVARVKAMTQPKFKAVKAFTLLNGSPELGYAAGSVAELLPGEVAQPIAGADKIQLIVLAARKAPAKAFKADDNLKMMYRNYKRSIQQMQYSAYLNANCKKYAESAQAQAVAE